MTFVRYFNGIDQSSVSPSIRVSMLYHWLPQTEDGEDDRVLDNGREDAQDARHNKGLNSIETCGGRGGGICSVTRNNDCKIIWLSYFAALKVLMMTRNRMTSRDILPGTTWCMSRFKWIRCRDAIQMIHTLGSIMKLIQDTVTKRMHGM